MSFVIISASDVLYGPTALSTEDSLLHDMLAPDAAGSSGASLTISRRKKYRMDKNERIMRKFESKLAECTKDKHGEAKAEKIRSKMDYLALREKERIAVNEEKKINFDPNGKAMVFKVEDAPVRVLNRLSGMGYTIMPSAGGSVNGKDAHRTGSFVWTLYKPNHMPTMYPTLSSPS